TNWTEDIGVTTSPGVYLGMPDEVYRKIPAVSKSLLWKFSKDPRTFHLLKGTKPEPPTKEQVRGSLVDCLVCSPSRLRDWFAILDEETKAWLLSRQQEAERRKAKEPKNIKAIKIYKDWVSDQGREPEHDELEDIRTAYRESQVTTNKFSALSAESKAHRAQMEAKGIPVISETLLDVAKEQAQQVLKHPTVEDLISDSCSQVAIVWQDGPTGLLCKGLADWFDFNGGFLHDLKTSPDTSPGKAKKKIYEFGYHVQAAFYRTGLEANGFEVNACGNIFSATQAPYVVDTYLLPEEMLKDGESGWTRYGLEHRGFRGMLDLYAQCTEDNRWPGHTNGFEELVA
ncbi:MAG: PD-(D/E)XK nuclease-like domain-containing protein, partial [Verrucomicrobiota bacterium]